MLDSLLASKTLEIRLDVDHVGLSELLKPLKTDTAEQLELPFDSLLKT